MTSPRSRSIPVGELRLFGDRAFLLGVEDAAHGRAVVNAIALADWAGIDDVIGGLATVLVTCGAATDMDEVHQNLIRLWRTRPDQPIDRAGQRPPVVVPTVFDGPDLSVVAGAVGATPAQVVAMVTSTPLTAAVIGFSPGFAYLSGLPDALADVPRRIQPRASVPAGSVALAHGHAAVYPNASPGGWQLIGRTNETFFSERQDPYARLTPGQQVQFVGADALPAPQRWGHDRATSTPVGSVGEAVFSVEEAGVWTVLQDGGRRQRAASGVPAAGPADPEAFVVANQLVGNRVDAGVLEITARGPTLTCLRPTFVAVLGGWPDIRVDGQPVEPGRVVPLMRHQRLVIGHVRHGFRTYVAVAGGLVGPEVMGSLATDQLSRLGPGPLRSGDQLWASAMTPPLGDHVDVAEFGRPLTADPIVLRVVPGPHHEQFGPAAWATLAQTTFIVDGQSNRVGLRLRSATGSTPLWRPEGVAPELDSQGVVTGAMQIPPSGDPVILLPDHATMGGYPVLGVVVSADHGMLGQCAPGDRVRLLPVSHSEARQAWAERDRRLARAVVGHYPLAVD